MSLLPYVVAFLMVLSALTYSRMGATRLLVPSLIAQMDYVKASQRFSQQKGWETKYDGIKVREGSGGDKKLFINGSAKLNLKPILDPEKYPPEKQEAYMRLFVRLVAQLHQDEPYFAWAQEQDPNWIEHLLVVLRNHKVKYLRDLSGVTLTDPFLDRMLYYLMKERKSLVEYTTFAQKEPLSVFLASPELLLAVYGDPAVVNEIKAVRHRVSREVRKKEPDVESLKKEFALLREQYPTSFTPYLSFDISKTKIKSG